MSEEHLNSPLKYDTTVNNTVHTHFVNAMCDLIFYYIFLSGATWRKNNTPYSRWHNSVTNLFNYTYKAALKLSYI